MISAQSVKDRLKTLANEEHSTMQNELILFALERTIYRLSISDYSEYFTLKGGIFLYALFNKNYPRATMDIDLLAEKISNHASTMKEVFFHIFSIPCDDALTYDLSTLQVKDITEFKDYHGVNVSILSFLDKTRIPVSIDIGFNDVISPNRIQMEFPVLLNMSVPTIYAYSIYSVIAEKFEAIVSLGFLNSRYKDFYDIYVLSKQFDLDGKELQIAILETFTHRKTDLKQIVAFSNQFMNDSIHQSRWKSFVKKKQVAFNLEFIEVIQQCKKLLLPIINAIERDDTIHAQWDFKLQIWKEKETLKD